MFCFAVAIFQVKSTFPVTLFKVALKFSDKEIKDLQAKLKIEKVNEAML